MAAICHAYRKMRTCKEIIQEYYYYFRRQSNFRSIAYSEFKSVRIMLSQEVDNFHCCLTHKGEDLLVFYFGYSCRNFVFESFHECFTKSCQFLYCAT